ncbi:hypothetical protein [Microcystis phage Mwe-JY26]
MTVYGTNIKDDIQAHSELIFRACGILREAEAEGSILKTTYKELRDLVNSAFDRTDNVIRKRHIFDGRYQNLSEKVTQEIENKMPHEVRHLDGFLKRVRLFHGYMGGYSKADVDYVEDIINLFTPFLAVWARVEALKDKQVAARVVREQQRQAQEDALPRASQAAKEAILAALEPIATKAKGQHMASTLSLFRSTLARVDRVIAEGGDVRKLCADPTVSYVVSVAFNAQRVMGGFEYTRDTLVDVEQAFQDEAERQGENIRRQFLSKGVDKLGAVIDRRPGAKCIIKAMSAGISRGVVEGFLSVWFLENGKEIASFDVKLQVVWARIGQTDYVRYPLTFHNVVRHIDGRIDVMKKPSEAKMKKEF